MSALVYPKFIGRLGNSMFQIAACIGYAKKYGVKWGIKKGYVEPGFGVNQVDRFMPDLPMCGGSYRRYAEHQRGWDNEWFNYHEIPFFPEGVELCGFFQSEKYFENAKEEVKATFGEYVKWRDFKGYSCSIHVRRGDYVQHSGSFPPVDWDYISSAIHKMYWKLYQEDYVLFDAFGEIEFHVCSDDISWCKNEFNSRKVYNGPIGTIRPKFIYHESDNEWEDFSILASCDHHINSNSTFAWWSAYLGRNPNKVVITPSAETWFGEFSGVKGPVYDLIPEGWIQIHTR